jgi:hypothetical protein
VNDILYQIGAVREFGRRHGVALQHVKPHGALYMEAAKNRDLSYKLVETLRRSSPEAILFCMGPSLTYEVARELGQPVAREFFADRDYGDDGAIVFRRKVARPDPQAIAQKCLRAMRLHMLQRNPVAAAEFPHRADLVQDVVHQLVVVHVDEATAKALKVTVAGMHPKAHAIGLRQFHHAVDAVGVAGVEAGSDVRGGDQRHQGLVRCLSQRPMAIALSHVAIQVDQSLHVVSRVVSVTIHQPRAFCKILISVSALLVFPIMGVIL